MLGPISVCYWQGPLGQVEIPYQLWHTLQPQLLTWNTLQFQGLLAPSLSPSLPFLFFSRRRSTRSSGGVFLQHNSFVPPFTREEGFLTSFLLYNLPTVLGIYQHSSCRSRGWTGLAHQFGILGLDPFLLPFKAFVDPLLDPFLGLLLRPFAPLVGPFLGRRLAQALDRGATRRSKLRGDTRRSCGCGATREPPA